MTFQHPHLLWLCLLAGPALAAFFWWSWRVRQRLIAQFVHTRLLGNLTVGVSRRRQRLRALLLIGSVLLLLVVLARPQWGFTWEEARQKGLDIVVAIDTSRSMLASDVAPNRLARAKLAALDLKRFARTDRVGLVAFAGSAFLQCPLSFDDEAFRQSVEALDVNIIPQGGSALAEAIDAARGAFKEKNDNYKVVILFTDGEDNDGRAREAARAAEKEGMRIYTIGVGTPNGELLRITDAKGRSDYVRDDQGNVVKSRLDEALLRDIAKTTGGFYMLLAGANTMELLYERGLAPLPKTEQSARRVRRYHERYQWFLGLAILLLLAEMFLPDRQRAPRAASETVRAPLARAAALVLLMFLPATSFAASPARALKKYQSGSFESAQWEYERLLKEKPDDPRLRFNAGAASFQSKDFESALNYFNSALVTPDLTLQQQAYYNLGNAQYRLGEKASDKKQEAWESAVKSYDSALQLNPNDADAKHNLEFVKKKLEELKQQQQQQSQSDQNKEEKEEEKQDQKQPQEQNKQEQEKQEQEKQQQQQEQEKQQQQQEQEKQQKQDQQQQSEQEKKEQEKAEKDREQQQAKSQEQKEPQGEPKDQEQARMARAVPMTPQEAQRLLDTLRSEEKAMIFIPQLRTNRQDRVLKDW